MNFVNDPWHIDPSDLLINDDGGAMYDSLYDANEFDKLLNMNYNDVDNMLTQELKDLDIPLIPQTTASENTDEQQSLDGPKFELSRLQMDHAYDSTKFASSAGGGNAGHKRGPSGTAIFGFLNHNRTLSISNLQKSINEDVSRVQSSFGSDDVTEDKDTNVGQVLLKQQEQLRIALQRQQEVNRRLEEQLRENRLQQQVLQRVLDEQQVVSHQLAKETTPRSSGTRTHKPANSLIITSNSENGGFQFPPPNMISPPNSNASLNGSPSRKPCQNRLKRGFNATRVSPPTSDLATFQTQLDYGTGFQVRSSGDRNGQKEVTNGENGLKGIEDIYKNPFCSKDQLTSSLHRKKESNVSTVSTIPQHTDDGSDSESGALLGLGIRMSAKSSSNGRSYSLRPPPVNVLPVIPGSSDNTPVGKQAQLPQKHTFQHTPIKTQNQRPQYQTHSQSVSDKLFSDDAGTPQLRPPSVPTTASRRSSNYSSDYPENGENEIDIDSQQLAVEEPESRFVVAQTPSPVLKSQARFEGSPHQFDLDSNNSASPLKITRKPTTLPRGSIDRYVKELPDRLFQCMYPNCNKIFKRRYNIRSHIQTHLEDRPYVCDFEGCDKAFVRNHDLVRHKKSHAEKSYACPCGKKFNREDALIVHRSRMICSGGKKYENVVIKKSPRRRGRPKKDGSSSVNSSPVKDSLARDQDGYLVFKMEEQLRNEMEKYGLFKPPSPVKSSAILSPVPLTRSGDLKTPCDS
ncbi:hypothetical protein HG536_0C01300 [Torulaspora globosa]|uniref:C2H2-type domain-containing protein n=1 Tax=Torulaspora globosa TaxID=48254 RepID=A0A7G3ZEM6_9SACH|nr:uncharacterized protein HG536_0C01300 [Torulaspora globosa]QLL31962.1 hypothetical protein HG536_0C01300 [Torulaspora globosa]